MSPFDRAIAIGSAPRYTLYGEQVTLTPQARKAGDNDARRTADQSRAAVTCIGIWDEVPTDTWPSSQTMPGKASHAISAGAVKLFIRKSDLPYEPLQGDLATRVDTGERLEVVDPAYDGITEWELTLSAKKG